MKKRLTILSGLGLVFVNVVTGCNANTNALNLLTKAPDYTRKKAEFITFGYTPPTSGVWYKDGVAQYEGQDNRTFEGYKQYRDAGLNCLMFQNEDAYDYDKGFAKSELKVKMDTAYAAGIHKMIVCDLRITNLCNATTPLICDEGAEPGTLNVSGYSKQFRNQEELNKAIGKFISDYYVHDGFYGVVIRDEPFIQHLPNYGLVYKAIKAFDHDIYVEGNLNPYSSSEDNMYRYTDQTGQTPEEAYQYYMDQFLLHSEADKLLMDSYPFIGTDSSLQMKKEHLKGMQLVADKCRDNNLNFEMVLQTMGGKNNGTRAWQKPTAQTMQWNVNAAMGFGVKTFGYFTYQRKVWNQTAGEWFNDNESFINSKGEKNELYYVMQNIHEEMQAFAPVITNFRYLASTTYAHEPCTYNTNYLSIKEEHLATVKNFSAKEGQMALLTELKDKSKNQYMVMVMNAFNPLYKPEDPEVMLDYEIDFGPTYNAVEVYYRGERSLHKLDNGVYRASLDAGYADYLLPYRA